MSRIEGVRNSMVDPAALTPEQKAEVLAAIDYLEAAEAEALKKLPDGEQALNRWTEFIDSIEDGSLRDFLDADANKARTSLLEQYAATFKANKPTASKQPASQTAGFNFGGKPVSTGAGINKTETTQGEAVVEHPQTTDGEQKEDAGAKKKREAKERWEAKEAELKSLKEQLAAAGVEKAKAEQATAEANRLAKEAETRTAQAEHETAKLRKSQLEQEEKDAKKRRDEFNAVETLQAQDERIKDMQDEIAAFKRALASKIENESTHATARVLEAPEAPSKTDRRAQELGVLLKNGFLVILMVLVVWLTFSTQCASPPSPTQAEEQPAVSSTAQTPKVVDSTKDPQAQLQDQVQELSNFHKQCLAKSFPPEYCSKLVEHYKKRQGYDVPTPP